MTTTSWAFCPWATSQRSSRPATPTWLCWRSPSTSPGTTTATSGASSSPAWCAALAPHTQRPTHVSAPCTTSLGHHQRHAWGLGTTMATHGASSPPLMVHPTCAPQHQYHRSHVTHENMPTGPGSSTCADITTAASGASRFPAGCAPLASGMQVHIRFSCQPSLSKAVHTHDALCRGTGAEGQSGCMCPTAPSLLPAAAGQHCRPAGWGAWNARLSSYAHARVPRHSCQHPSMPRPQAALRGALPSVTYPLFWKCTQVGVMRTNRLKPSTHAQVGVMHTNYTELAIRTGGFGVGYLMCGLMHTINWCLCGMHCHRVRTRWARTHSCTAQPGLCGTPEDAAGWAAPRLSATCAVGCSSSPVLLCCRTTAWMGGGQRRLRLHAQLREPQLHALRCACSACPGRHGRLWLSVGLGVQDWRPESSEPGRCPQVVKLSGAVQRLPREVIENVHGVAPRFLDMPEGEPRVQGLGCSRRGSGLGWAGPDLACSMPRQQAGAEPWAGTALGHAHAAPSAAARGCTWLPGAQHAALCVCSSVHPAGRPHTSLLPARLLLWHTAAASAAAALVPEEAAAAQRAGETSARAPTAWARWSGARAGSSCCGCWPTHAAQAPRQRVPPGRFRGGRSARPRCAPLMAVNTRVKLPPQPCGLNPVAGPWSSVHGACPQHPRACPAT